MWNLLRLFLDSRHTGEDQFTGRCSTSSALSFNQDPAEMLYGFQNVENRIRREYPIFRIVENLSLLEERKIGVQWSHDTYLRKNNSFSPPCSG
jgi:hypothetical protein